MDLCGEYGDEITWKQVGDVLYIAGQGELEDYAFCGDSSIRKVVISPGCTEIGEGTFFVCENLQTMELPEGLLRIGEEVFLDCENLQEINLPKGLQEIGANAFSLCKNLKLLIPDSVTEIGENAFEDVPCIIYNGPALSEDNWGAVSALRVRVEEDVLHIACKGSLMSVPKLNVKEVVLHEGCTDIEAFAFMDWDNLDTVHTPFSLCHIDQNAFSGCHDVTLNMCNTRPVWNSRDNVFSGVYRVLSWLPHRIEGDTLYIGPDDKETPYILQMRAEGVYEPDTWERYRGYPWGRRVINKIRAAVIAPGCQEIDESVFYGHTALETVKIPMGVLKIGMCAFMGCENLKDLEIPDSVTKIGRNAFYGVPHIIYNGPAQSDDNWGAKSRN